MDDESQAWLWHYRSDSDKCPRLSAGARHAGPPGPDDRDIRPTTALAVWIAKHVVQLGQHWRQWFKVGVEHVVSKSKQPFFVESLVFI